MIVNEFGEIGIDNELVVGADEELFEMNNGCLCCTVRGDLIRILGGLMRRSGFDAIIVETTGLADPAPVAQTFFVDAEVKAASRLDAMVTLADAKWLIHLERPPEAKNQLAFADVIVLNKTDLVSPAELAEVEARIRGINPYARLHRAIKAEVPLTAVLEQNAFDLERILEIEPNFLHRPKSMITRTTTTITITPITTTITATSTIRASTTPPGIMRKDMATITMIMIITATRNTRRSRPITTKTCSRWRSGTRVRSIRRASCPGSTS